MIEILSRLIRIRTGYRPVNLQRPTEMTLRLGMLTMVAVKHAKLHVSGGGLGMIFAMGLLTEFGRLVKRCQRLGLASAVQQRGSQLARALRQACMVGLVPGSFQARDLRGGLLGFGPLALIEMDLHQRFHGP